MYLSLSILLPSISTLQLIYESSNIFTRFFKEGGAKLEADDLDLVENLVSSLDKILYRDAGSYAVFSDVETDAAGDVIDPILQGISASTFDSAAYIKAAERIADLNNLDRSGDLVLLFNDKTTDAISKRYSSGAACKSWHGSLNPSDSYVPLIMSYPGGRSDSVQPYVEEFCPGLACDRNWKLTDIVKKLAEIGK